MSAAVYPGLARPGGLAALEALVRGAAFAVLALVLVLAFPTQPPSKPAHARLRAVQRGAPTAGAQQYNFITGE